MDLNEIVDFVMTLEAAFGIEIEDSDAAAIETVGDLHRAVAKIVSRPGGPMPAEVWSTIVSVFEMNGIPPQRIKPETRLADLFGD